MENYANRSQEGSANGDFTLNLDLTNIGGDNRKNDFYMIENDDLTIFDQIDAEANKILEQVAELDR